jgi:signal transduction histidine kinase
LIDSVAVNEQAWRPGSHAELPPKTARVEIEYTSLNLSSAAKTRFRFRLDGFDRDWIEGGRRRRVVYTNLAPGNYRFRVIANGGLGPWPDQGAEWSFSVEPMFYETTWFYAVAAMLVAGVFLASWRLQALLAGRRFSLILAERARLSREIHDTLLQSLVGLGLQMDVLSKQADTHAVRAHLVRLRQQAEQCVDEVRQAVWDLRSHRLQRADLAEVLSAAAQRATVNTGIKVEFTACGTPGRCSPKIEQQILRIGEEAIVNAVRHADPTRISIELEFGAGLVRLRVIDNGRGFEAPQPTERVMSGWGLAGMRERAKSVGGSLQVCPVPGEGTTVDLVIPYNRAD